jgi:lipoyl(octanoyl) transferase
MERADWRLIVSSPGRGAWNMALDEAILESVGKADSLPTLRFYGWDPACLSIGYAQSISDIDFNAVQKRHLDVVRRPTGGKAIFHFDEFTYSVIAPHGEPRLAGDVLHSYRNIAQALLMGLHLLGIPAIALPEYSIGLRDPGPICFEVPSKYEITVNNKKIIGSAQARKKAGILQHGSLPLNGDRGEIVHVLMFEPGKSREDAAELLSKRSTTASKELHRAVSWNEAAKAFEIAFSQALDIRLINTVATQQEADRAALLVLDKYDNESWTKRI